MELQGIDHIALSVRDIDRSAQWYIEILGFERRYEQMWNGIPTFVGKGSTAIALFPIRNGSEPQHQAATRGILHLAFRADAKNFTVAQNELKRRGIPFEFQDHEISHSIYFRDPDDHQLEVTTYEI